MNKKAKRAATAAALVLAMGAGAVGTWAYLSKTTNTITNTFTAQAGLYDETNGFFKLTEHGVTKQDSGKYEFYNTVIEATEDQNVQYDKVVPGAPLPKDPTVTVKGLTGDCYVFVVVDNGLADIDTNTEGKQTLGVAIDGTNWKPVPKTNEGGPATTYNNVFYKEVTKTAVTAAGDNGLLLFRQSPVDQPC